MRILVIEDERALCETIVRSLKRLAYSVDFCYDGNKANELLGIEKYDLVLLDLNLPGADGMTVLRTLRQTDRDTGVLILSARCEVADKVEGLDAGANDYLTKPFHLEELEARIRSLTRRRFTQNNVVLNCGKVAFDTKARVAVADGQELSLTRKEIGILEYLLLNQGRPVSQEELLDHVWDNSVDNFSNSIRVIRFGYIFLLCAKKYVPLSGMTLFATVSVKDMLWRKKKYEKAILAMAHNSDDCTPYRSHLHFYECSYRLFRQPLYGFHRLLCYRLR